MVDPSFARFEVAHFLKYFKRDVGFPILRAAEIIIQVPFSSSIDFRVVLACTLVTPNLNGLRSLTFQSPGFKAISRLKSAAGGDHCLVFSAAIAATANRCG